jgi:hypothetical protein
MWSDDGAGRYVMRLDTCHLDSRGEFRQTGVGLGNDYAYPSEFTAARFKDALAKLSAELAKRGATRLFAPAHVEGLPHLTPEVQANFEAAFA